MQYVRDRNYHGKGYQITTIPFTISRESKVLDKEVSAKIIGFADKVGSDIVGLFAKNSRAFVFVNNICWDVLDDDIKVACRRIVFVDFFKLTSKGKLLYFKVKVSWREFCDGLRDPTTDGIDESWVNVLGSISNLVNDKKRCIEWAKLHSG